MKTDTTTELDQWKILARHRIPAQWENANRRYVGGWIHDARQDPDGRIILTITPADSPQSIRHLYRFGIPAEYVRPDPGAADDGIGRCVAPDVFGCPEGRH